MFRRIQTEDLPFIAACKDDVKLFKAGRKGQEEPSPRRLSTESNNSSSSTATTTDLTTPPATTTATLVAAATEPRRERKSKFSVKDIFNFRKQGGNSSSADVVSTNTTTEVKSEDGAVATASFVESGSGVIKRRNSSLSRVGGSEVKEAAGGGELQRSDNGVGLVSLSSSTGDDGCLAATVVAATVASSSRHDVGRLQTRRRRGGKRSVSSDHRKRNDKQDEEEEDRNGNSPQVRSVNNSNQCFGPGSAMPHGFVFIFHSICESGSRKEKLKINRKNVRTFVIGTGGWYCICNKKIKKK